MPVHSHVDLSQAIIALGWLEAKSQTEAVIDSEVSFSKLPLHQQHHEQGFHSVLQSVVGPESKYTMTIPMQLRCQYSKELK